MVLALFAGGAGEVGQPEVVQVLPFLLEQGGFESWPVGPGEVAIDEGQRAGRLRQEVGGATVQPGECFASHAAADHPGAGGVGFDGVGAGPGLGGLQEAGELSSTDLVEDSKMEEAIVEGGVGAAGQFSGEGYGGCEVGGAGRVLDEPPESDGSQVGAGFEVGEGGARVGDDRRVGGAEAEDGEVELMELVVGFEARGGFKVFRGLGRVAEAHGSLGLEDVVGRCLAGGCGEAVEEFGGRGIRRGFVAQAGLGQAQLVFSRGLGFGNTAVPLQRVGGSPQFAKACHDAAGFDRTGVGAQGATGTEGGVPEIFFCEEGFGLSNSRAFFMVLEGRPGE